MTDWSELNLLSPLWLLSNQFNWLIAFRMKELRGCVRALKWDCYHKSNRKLIFFSPLLFFSNSNPILSLSAYFFKSHSSPLEDFWHNKSVLLIFNPNLLRASRSYFCCCSWISVCFYDFVLKNRVLSVVLNKSENRVLSMVLNKPRRATRAHQLVCAILQLHFDSHSFLTTLAFPPTSWEVWLFLREPTPLCPLILSLYLIGLSLQSCCVISRSFWVHGDPALNSLT